MNDGEVSLHAEMLDWLETAPRSVKRSWDVTDAIPTEYRGTMFRSALESAWARTLDRYGIKDWKFEPETVRLESGERYVPDFRIEGLRTWIEVKGPHMHRADKARQFARDQGPSVIVLLGFPAVERNLGPAARPHSMQWLDAHGYDARFTLCGECGAWQWLRPQLSRACRRCNSLCNSMLAKPGEMEFIPAQDEPYIPARNGLCHGSALTTAFTRTPRCWRHPWQQGACGRPLARGRATISPMASWQITCSRRSAAPQSLRPSWLPRGCGSAAATAGSSTSGRRKTPRERLWKRTGRTQRNGKDAAERPSCHAVTHTVTAP